jgi:hypothetical protein
LDSAHFGCNALHVIAQALLGFKSLEPPRIDIGNTVLGSFVRLRLPQNLLFEIGQVENLHSTERVHPQQVNITRDKNIMLKNSTAKNFRWLTVWIQSSGDERTRIEDNSFTGVTHGQACLIVQA